MNSRLYIGSVMHARFQPVAHRFTYPTFTMAFDLDELEELDDSLRGFAYNRFNWVSLHDCDYLRGEGSIRQKLNALLAEHGITPAPERVMLVTTARFLGYAFNPVSFYMCYDHDERPRVVVAEVNNTFGEKHVYVLKEPLGDPHTYPLVYRQAKTFHVSPFNDMAGYYHLGFSELGETLRATVTLFREQEGKVLFAVLRGRMRPLNGTTLRDTLLRYPLTTLLTFPRITWQAVRLRFQRGLRVYSRPAPSSPMTLRPAPAKRAQILARRVIEAAWRRLRKGHLTVTFPEGDREVFGDASRPGASLTIRDHRFFTHLARAGAVGFGDAYVDGLWDTDDLAGVLRRLAADITALRQLPKGMSRLHHVVNWLRHARRRNTVDGSRRNIQAHYDLGNDFYRTFLDEETLMYSCAVHEPPDLELGAAQRLKIERITALAGLSADDHVLEIGCGWGGFALEAVRRSGCRVTGITVSDEQYALARERVSQAGLEDRIDIRLCDYRHVEGTFSRIVSIEMLEAVGHAFLATFFQTCEARLAPGGRAVIQVITIPDARYEEYRRHPDWIQKRVFPGGHLPCLAELRRVVAHETNLVWASVEAIGPHYALTLKAWRERFNARAEELLAMGFDAHFQRLWNYYLAYCEAGFSEGLIDDVHIVLNKQG